MLDKSYSILVTAIGSFSGDCVVYTLKELGCCVIGCDTYPSEWHAISKECDKVYKVPFVLDEKEYIDSLLSICKENKVKYLFPLTDPEVDAINRNRTLFSENRIIPCIVGEFAISIARNKFTLYETFKDDIRVPSILTYKSKTDKICNISIPCIAKPVNGRSSEGFLMIESLPDMERIMELGDYVIQEYIDGPIYAVDYVRCKKTGCDFAIPREELLRTKNGAGITVQITNDDNLVELVSYIGNKLDVNGCINMEFIKNKENYYLIDVNPRFSAGVAFSKLSGYSMVESHLNCFLDKNILNPMIFKNQIMTKRYKEEILSV